MGSFTDGLKDFGKSVASSAADVLGGSAAGAVVDNILGNGGPDYTDAVASGSNMNFKKFKRAHRYKWRFGTKKGLTDVEILGNGAGMSGQPSGTEATILGNQAGAAALQERQQRLQYGQMALERQTELEKSEIAADAQRDVAKIHRDGVAETNATKELIANNQLALDKTKLTQVVIPQLMSDLRLQEQQIKEAMNKVITSSPKYQLKTIILKMGVENSIQTLVLGKHRLDLSDPKSLASLTDEEYSAALSALLAVSSPLPKTAMSVQGLVDFLLGQAQLGPGTNPNYKGKKPKDVLGNGGPEGLTEGQRRVLKSHSGNPGMLMDSDPDWYERYQ